eukprot:5868209-Amphidinium_carterae.2
MRVFSGLTWGLADIRVHRTRRASSPRRLQLTRLEIHAHFQVKCVCGCHMTLVCRRHVRSVEGDGNCQALFEAGLIVEDYKLADAADLDIVTSNSTISTVICYQWKLPQSCQGVARALCPGCSMLGSARPWRAVLSTTSQGVLRQGAHAIAHGKALRFARWDE